MYPLALGQNSKIKTLSGWGRGGGRFLIQILSDTLDYLFPSHTFLQRTYYFFHISQPAKICLKNRYFEKRIHWVPLLIDGFWSKALLLLLRHETIPSAIRSGNDRLFSVLSEHKHPCFRNLNSTLQWWRYFVVWVKYILGSFFFQQCLFLLQFHNLQVIFASFLLQLPGFIWV